MNKCDLVKQRSDLLKRANTLTCGTIGGTKITIEGPRLGKLGKLTKSAPSSLFLTPMKDRIAEKDEKWLEAYK
jgi:hypothetical protein